MAEIVKGPSVDKFCNTVIGNPVSEQVRNLLENSKEFEEAIKNLNEDGSHLWKVRGPSKFFRRKFSLDLKDMHMKYEPTSKSPCYKKHKQNIELGEIVEIRQGWKTDTFNKIEASEAKKRSKKKDYRGTDENRCFSIIYGTRRDTWDLIAPTSETAEKWVRALNHLLSLYRSREEKQGYERWLRKQFTAADMDKNKCLSFPETLRLLKQLNIEMDESDVKKLFREANVRKSKPGTPEVLDEDEFIKMYFALLKRPDFENLYDSIAEPSGSVGAREICEFLKREQGDDFTSCTEEDCAQMIKIYEPVAEMKSKGEMSVSGFLNMLLSPQFDIFNARHKVVYQEMKHPLSHYFIASSHNTYLVGNQLSGTSSVEGYIDALKRGCRCCELDCWDGENGEPIVYHGFTLTNKILFKEILSDAIKPYAFVASRYPLILSLENHCTEEYQMKMAEHLKNILGDMLYLVDPDENMEFLPSPEELQGKILVKAKKTSRKVKEPALPNTMIPPPPALDDDKDEENKSPSKNRDIDFLPKGDTSSDTTANSIPRVDDGLLPKSSQGWAGPPKASMESLGDDSDESEADETIDYIDGVGVTKKKSVSNDLSSLVNLIQAVKFHSFEDCRQHRKCYEMSSFSEAKTNNFIITSGEALVEYNKRQLSRIYPAGSRTTSSNFNPIDYWNVGCQIVALNYQTEDIPNFFNYALFTNNGSCGYVLKPAILRDPNLKFDSKTKLPKDRGLTLKVRLISGQHIPKAPGNSEVVDPYVEVKILGIEQDRALRKTEVVNNNGFNPVWNETFNFRVYCPELAMLYFRVKDYSNSGTDMHLAHFASPLGSITTGYRHVHLVTLKGTPMIPSTLFVHITVQNHAAEGAMNGSPIK
ncbi:1-phosphatidylinositol 4,5-bisphosphate phosphodiesterase delta-1 isoform X2 [Folsomia candida]|uniref:1-phosphatidylinositol 4,5-bisphosphate phosphodiesterase delta-1 isoform X2 n=1 Tax=Folsomia candida TaxID=158441 RepID=UPI001604D773|nr:1-phosphatidylinositol 4,5-bisphosphate phosphodiesterase delta-1 isoform X2 [Folsomia candida]